MFFTVGVYNKFVRNALRSGEDFTGPINLAFEEVQYFEMEAGSLLDVEKAVERNYPSRAGYVIDFIKTIKSE